jgi:REP element-mobilizing transposase RayT
MSTGPRLVQRHSRNLLLVHVVWATKFRSSVLDLGSDRWLAANLERQAYEAGCRLIASGNAADHVHTLIRLPSTVRLADAVHRMKGGSSYAWRSQRRAPELSWQAGYWAESFGPADLAKHIRYVEDQRLHHREASTLEPWESELPAATT